MIVFDTEATGLPKPESVPLQEHAHLVEFAAIKLDSKTLKEKSRLEFMVDPQIVLPDDFVRITKITQDMVAGKPLLVTQYPALVDFFLGEREMVAHNVAYDRYIMLNSLRRLGKETQFPWPPKHICTVEASYGLKNFRLNLSKLHEIATGSPHKDAHRAMGDVEALVQCVRWLRKEGHL
jgi:DNA polymerase III epsilon subunit-like protein